MGVTYHGGYETLLSSCLCKDTQIRLIEIRDQHRYEIIELDHINRISLQFKRTIRIAIRVGRVENVINVL